MEPVEGAPNIHLPAPDAIEVPDERMIRDALEESGSREVRVVILGKVRRRDDWFVVEEYWRGEPQWRENEKGEIVWDGPWPEERRAHAKAAAAGMNYVKIARRATI